MILGHISVQCSHFIPPKTPEKLKFSVVFRRYKLWTMARNGLIEFLSQQLKHAVSSSSKYKVRAGQRETLDFSFWRTLLFYPLLFYPQTREEWRQVFIINASMYAFGLIWYAIFASGEKEPWADGISSQDNTRENDDLEKLLSSKEESPRKRGNYHSDKID